MKFLKDGRLKALFLFVRTVGFLLRTTFGMSFAKKNIPFARIYIRIVENMIFYYSTQ